MKYYVLIGSMIFLSIINCSSPSNNDSGANMQSNGDKEVIQKIERNVSENILVSNGTPSIKIEVNKEFDYIGRFDFDIIASTDEYPEELQGKAIASGERFVFLKADDKQSVEKLYIVQFEGFLPQNDYTYNYNFSSAEPIGDNKYRHNTWIYDAKSNAKSNPLGEGAKTIKFIEDKGFNLEDVFMMSRFVGLASADRKNEIIIYYQEMLSKTTGLTLKEFDESISSEKKDSIITSLISRSKNSFKIIEG